MDNKEQLLKKDWYSESTQDIFNFFKTSRSGLKTKTIEKYREKYGANVLDLEKTRTLKDIIIAQINSPLVYILIVASVLMLFLRDYVDAAIIMFIVVLNTIIGAIQEGKAEDTLGALKKVIKSYATVIRDGDEITIEDSELVPGDIVTLKDGSVIPADCRLVEANDLKVNQSALTGESEPIIKSSKEINKKNLSFNEQDNMVFRGTYIISGLGQAVVVRTGIDTLIGQISKKLRNINTEVPLKRKIKKLSRIILVVVSVISILLMTVGVYRGEGLLDMLLVVVAVAVSAIPESLPVIVTLVLASGVWRMSEKKVLVKRLQAVEALGQATVIALDKTGTITKNQMTVGKIYTNNRYIDVTGEGYSESGNFVENGNNINLEKSEGDILVSDKDLDLIGKISTFTSIATFNKADKNNWKLEIGDPTEAALKILGLKMGMEKENLESRFPKKMEIPFNMKNKFHATLNQFDGHKMFSMAGGPEAVIGRCDTVLENGRRKKLDTIEKNKLESVVNQFSSDGYRILALAADLDSDSDVDENINGLTFIGFVGISDAIRPEVYDSVLKAKDANMKVVMITGDHVKTAEAIARKVGIFNDGDRVLTGHEINNLSDEAIVNILDKVTVFARVSPEDKLRIIKSFKAKGDTIAMTGDGINDALSLVAADLGVAMGQNGTEVAREAADLVLVDDDFGNIISAAEEGRHIYWVIRKSISHLLSTNVGELLVIVLAILVGLPLPLIATQIIWLNLVTDTFLVSALSVEPKEPNLMSEIYRKTGGNIVDKMMVIRILMVSGIMAAVTLFLFTKNLGGDMNRAWTISLTMLTIFQCFNIFNVKSHQRTIFSKNTFDNKYLILGVFGAISLHLFAIYNPFMQSVLKTAALSMNDWFLIVPLALLVVFAEEVRKFIYRNFFAKLKPAN
jgi:Ca2+-transporting ATPase